MLKESAARPDVKTRSISDHTTSNPAFLNKMACAMLTYAVAGINEIIPCSPSGILSRGVKAPERRFMGKTTRINKSPICGMEWVIVPRKMPSPVVKTK